MYTWDTEISLLFFFKKPTHKFEICESLEGVSIYIFKNFRHLLLLPTFLSWTAFNVQFYKIWSCCRFLFYSFGMHTPYFIFSILQFFFLKYILKGKTRYHTIILYIVPGYCHTIILTNLSTHWNLCPIILWKIQVPSIYVCIYALRVLIILRFIDCSLNKSNANSHNGKRSFVDSSFDLGSSIQYTNT